MNKVLCVGELLIDFIGEKTDRNLSQQSSFLMKPGGAPGNVACTIGALSGKCALLSSVGADAFGDFLTETVLHFRVAADLIKRSNKPTTLAFVSVQPDGNRDFIFNRGADADLELTLEEMNGLSEYGMIHFGAATGFLEGNLKKTYSSLLDWASKNGKFISFDPNYRSAFWESRQDEFIAQMDSFLMKSHLVKLSDDEAKLISGKSTLDLAEEWFKEHYKGVFAITLGAEGSLIFNRNFSMKIPAADVKVLDTTGAGDAFIGAMLYELSKEALPEESVLDQNRIREIAVRAGNVASGVCTEYGALTALEKLMN